MASTNDGIWMYCDLWPNFVVGNAYLRWGHSLSCGGWSDYKKECYRLAPKELMVWENE